MIVKYRDKFISVSRQVNAIPNILCLVTVMQQSATPNIFGCRWLTGNPEILCLITATRLTATPNIL